MELVAAVVLLSRGGGVSSGRYELTPPGAGLTCPHALWAAPKCQAFCCADLHSLLSEYAQCVRETKDQRVAHFMLKWKQN